MSGVSNITLLSGRAKNAVLRMVPQGVKPANEPKRAPRFSDRVRARTELIRTYAGRLGLTTVASDITEAISLHQDQNGLVGEAALLSLIHI